MAVSRVARTPWGDLSAFAILAINYTGTKRTVLVSQCAVQPLEMEVCHPLFWIKTGMGGVGVRKQEIL